MCHEGQKGQHHEPFQGQEHGQGMSLPCKGQQQEAGAQEGTLNKHVAMEGPKTSPKRKISRPPTLGRGSCSISPGPAEGEVGTERRDHE